MKIEDLSPKERKIWQEFERNSLRVENSSEVDVKVKKETEAQKKKRIARLLKPGNFDQFINYYFGSDDFKPAPLAWFHWEAIDNVLVHKYRKHIWEWHRESAKSVFADIFLVIHMLVSGELDGLILASQNADKAKNLLKDVEVQLRKNKRLLHDFGDFGISGSFMSAYFCTSKGVGFWCFGLGQDPAGTREGFKRPNLGIVDDADNKKTAKNQELTEEHVEWIKGEFMGCLAKDNRRFIYVNNRVHKKGITAHLVGDIDEDDQKDKSFTHIKVHLTEDPITHEPIYPINGNEAEILQDLIEKGAKPAWDEYYSLEDCVAKIIDYGFSTALRQMYHHQVEPGTTFTEDNLVWAHVFPLEKYDAILSYCDPAFGESGKASYKAIALVGKKGHLYDVLWIWLRQKGNWLKEHRYLAEETEKIDLLKFNPDKLEKVKSKIKHWCEANDLQRTELRKSYEIENLNYSSPWYPKYDTERKGDKIGRIEQMETIANHHHLRFNIAMKGSKDMTTLRDQFKGFPNGKIDGPDCIQGARNKLDKMTRKKGKKTRKGKFNKDSKRLW